MAEQNLSAAQLLTTVALGSLTLTAIVNVVLGTRELVTLRRLLLVIVGSVHIDDQTQLVELQSWLRRHIRWVRGREASRPLLRDSATRILATGNGFCGENARVASLLLNLGGVPARRLYLKGPRWGHVLVEHRWGTSWVAFDAHADPGTLLPPESLGRIPSNRIDLLPNAYRESNPWIRSYRVRLMHRVPRLGRRLEQIRLPTIFSVISESPYFLRACLTLALAALIMVSWMAV